MTGITKIRGNRSSRKSGTSTNEPQIIGFGRGLVGDYNVSEFKASLVRAFKDEPNGFIVLDSNTRGHAFLAATAAWAIDRKLLRVDRTVKGDQETVSSFRLTEVGKRKILDQQP